MPGLASMSSSGHGTPDQNSIAKKMPMKTIAGAEVGLRHDQQPRHAHHQQRAPQLDQRARVLALRGEHARQHQRGRELGQLRRLPDAYAADGEPPLRRSPPCRRRVPNEQHHHEQRAAEEIQRPRAPLEQAHRAAHDHRTPPRGTPRKTPAAAATGSRRIPTGRRSGPPKRPSRCRTPSAAARGSAADSRCLAGENRTATYSSVTALRVRCALR